MPLITLPLTESSVTAPVLVSPSVIAPPAVTPEIVTAPVSLGTDTAPVPSACKLMVPPEVVTVSVIRIEPFEPPDVVRLNAPPAVVMPVGEGAVVIEPVEVMLTPPLPAVAPFKAVPTEFTKDTAPVADDVLNATVPDNLLLALLAVISPVAVKLALPPATKLPAPLIAPPLAVAVRLPLKA